MSRLIIKFSNPDIMQSQPWPVAVNAEGIVTSGLGEDDGAYLIGFGPKGEYSIDVLREDAIAAPEKIVGLVPTFSSGGSIFEWSIPVTKMTVIQEEVTT